MACPPTPSVSTRRHARTTDLRDCLLEFTSRETLTQLLTCEACREPRRTSKQLSLTTTPPVLVVQLKRFDAISQRKLSTPVKFPLHDLDLRPFMSQNVRDGVGLGLRDPTAVVPPSARRTPRTSSSGTPHHVRIHAAGGEEATSLGISNGLSNNREAAGVGVGTSGLSSNSGLITSANSAESSNNSADYSSNNKNNATGVSIVGAAAAATSGAVPRLSLQVPPAEPPANDVVPSKQVHDSSMYDLCGLVSHIGSLNQV